MQAPPDLELAGMLHTLRGYWVKPQPKPANGTPDAKGLADLILRLTSVLDVRSLDEIVSPPSLRELQAFLGRIRQLMAAIGEAGLLATPFGGQMLKRDEVRNTAVLAWFMDSRSRLGFHMRLMAEILACVGKVVPHFPAAAGRNYRVRTESAPVRRMFTLGCLEVLHQLLPFRLKRQ
jgi:hypothetical protein